PIAAARRGAGSTGVGQVPSGIGAGSASAGTAGDYSGRCRGPLGGSAAMADGGDPGGRGPPGPPPAGGETARPPGSPGRPPAIFPWKCGGLNAAGLRATLGPSAMTLGGLLKHLALIEDEYFSHRLPGREPGPPWDAVDGDADPDGEWHSAAEDSPAQLMTLWQDAVARSRAAVAGGTGQRRPGPPRARRAG